MAGSRLYQDTRPADEAAIHAYGARLLHLLETPWPTGEGKRNELDPPELVFDPAAERLWRDFFNHVERQSGAGGDLDPIRDLASKAAELAARIAGVISVVSDHHVTMVSGESSITFEPSWRRATAIECATCSGVMVETLRNGLRPVTKQTSDLKTLPIPARIF